MRLFFLVAILLGGCSSTPTLEAAADEDGDITVDEALTLKKEKAAVGPIDALECYRRLGVSGASAQPEVERACRVEYEKRKADVPCKLALPRSRKGCQVENCACAFGDRLARATELRAAPAQSARELSKLGPGTRFASRTFSAVTEKLGRAATLRSFDIDGEVSERLVVMDILSYEGEGQYEFCQGRETKSSLESEGYWVALAPVARDWVRVRTRDGREGWIEAGALESREGAVCPADG